MASRWSICRFITGAVNGTDLPGAIARFGELSYESLRSNEIEIAVMKLV